MPMPQPTWSAISVVLGSSSAVIASMKSAGLYSLVNEPFDRRGRLVSSVTACVYGRVCVKITP